MHATTPLPLLKRVPPGAWTAAAWCAGTAYAFLVQLPLLGEPVPDGRPHLFLSHLFLAPGNGLNLLGSAVAALTGSLLARRRPLGGLLLQLLGSVLGAMALNSTEIDFTQFLPVGVAVALVASSRPRRASLLAALLALGTVLGYPLVRLLCGFPTGTSTELGVALTTAVAWLVGDGTLGEREDAAEAAARTAQQAVADERLRIARELHDMVAHSLGIVALQAGAARRVLVRRPDQAEAALGAIEQSGRETLAGLRRMLGALRGAEAEGASRTPAPGLADLDRLAAATTAAGVRVDVRWHGQPRPLPPEVDLSAYRIVQESITNVVRHAAARSCRVSLDCGEEALRVEVVDDGRGGSAVPGYGLRGMRERVTLLRGEFSADGLPGGGFRVAATLPLASASAVAAR
ncbi:sensor histidine kinase [Streptacidiphilus monticola]|uniref:histidine kinase n=1 Tax=Streptacidiphilus monticola TaxID=2161674 RepID=A0ABW1G232_9ACTN